MRSYAPYWAVAALVAGIVLINSVFIVDQTEFALVLRFGQVTRTITEPGLNFKAPFVEDVTYMDNRIHNLDPPPAPLTLSDKKRLNIDAFARWKIVDPKAFYVSLRTEDRAELQLGSLINGSVLNVFGNVPLHDILSEKRDGIMNTVRDQVKPQARPLGLELVDVRIGRADLPPETLDAVFKQMSSDRQREAAGTRAAGDQDANSTRTGAEADRANILSTARKEAQDTMGEADKQAIQIYADAAKLDPEFYGFYRSLLAYRTGLAGSSTTFVLSPGSEFFRYFSDPAGHGAKTPSRQ